MRGEKSMSELVEKESKVRDIFIEGAIIGLGRNLVLGKLPGNYKNDPS